MQTRKFMERSLQGDSNTVDDDELMVAPTNDRSSSTLKKEHKIVSKAKHSQSPFNVTTQSPVDQTHAVSGYLGPDNRSSEGVGQYTLGTASKESHRSKTGSITLPNIDY